MKIYAFIKSITIVRAVERVFMSYVTGIYTEVYRQIYTASLTFKSHSKFNSRSKKINQA